MAQLGPGLMAAGGILLHIVSMPGAGFAHLWETAWSCQPEVFGPHLLST